MTVAVFGSYLFIPSCVVGWQFERRNVCVGGRLTDFMKPMSGVEKNINYLQSSHYHHYRRNQHHTLIIPYLPLLLQTLPITPPPPYHSILTIPLSHLPLPPSILFDAFHFSPFIAPSPGDPFPSFPPSLLS